MLIDTEIYRDNADDCRRIARTAAMPSQWLAAAKEWEGIAELAEQVLELESTALELLRIQKEKYAHRT